MSITETKNNLFDHSAAKVELYTSYLTKYLIILDQSEYVKSINVFDVFCGLGIYENGGKGSPVQAFELIKSLKDNGKLHKKVNLWLNDFKQSRVTRVRTYIENNFPNQDYCDLKYTDLDANDCLELIRQFIIKERKETRNLLFVDPYGYKVIRREVIESLMSIGHVEILVFLPIDNMYRFTNYALGGSCESSIAPLTGFLQDFFPPDHRLITNGVNNELDLIMCLSEVFSFGGKYYSTSYYIERSLNKYYALFFITANARGCEKMLETKWALDEQSGRGFRKEEPHLFTELYAEEVRQNSFDLLKERMEVYLRSDKTNEEIYDFVLRNGFLPKHANDVLRSFQDEGRLIVIGPDNVVVRKGAFYIKYIPASNKGKSSFVFHLKNKE